MLEKAMLQFSKSLQGLDTLCSKKLFNYYVQ